MTPRCPRSCVSLRRSSLEEPFPGPCRSRRLVAHHHCHRGRSAYVHCVAQRGRRDYFAITRTVTVLVIACPHALGLAIPLVTSNATGMAAQNGVLVKYREAFDGAAISDRGLGRAGTLTRGPFCGFWRCRRRLRPGATAGIAAAPQRHSEHPIAAAIVEADAASGTALERVRSRQCRGKAHHRIHRRCPVRGR